MPELERPLRWQDGWDLPLEAMIRRTWKAGFDDMVVIPISVHCCCWLSGRLLSRWYTSTLFEKSPHGTMFHIRVEANLWTFKFTWWHLDVYQNRGVVHSCPALYRSSSYQTVPITHLSILILQVTYWSLKSCHLDSCLCSRYPSYRRHLLHGDFD